MWPCKGRSAEGSTEPMPQIYYVPHAKRQKHRDSQLRTEPHGTPHSPSIHLHFHAKRNEGADSGGQTNSDRLPVPLDFADHLLVSRARRSPPRRPNYAFTQGKEEQLRAPPDNAAPPD